VTDDFPFIRPEDVAEMWVKPEDWAAMRPTREDLVRAAAGKPGVAQKIAVELLAGWPDR
jgi:hypothetical protein